MKLYLFSLTVKGLLDASLYMLKFKTFSFLQRITCLYPTLYNKFLGVAEKEIARFDVSFVIRVSKYMRQMQKSIKNSVRFSSFPFLAQKLSFSKNSFSAKILLKIRSYRHYLYSKNVVYSFRNFPNYSLILAELAQMRNCLLL